MWKGFGMKRFILSFAAAFCCAAVSYGADGFGAATTGGAGGEVVTVTDPAVFQGYVETVGTPYVVQVSGTLDLASLDSGKVRIQSNKTIRGIGENPTIIGQLGFKDESSNVIIERLNISCPSGYGEGDGISIKEDITNVFVTKCTLYNCYDGCLDITRRSDYITVSWCKFYFSHTANNDRVSLIGGGDTHDDDGKLHITFHHNWFSTGCWQRIPSVRFGRLHIYNNYYNCPDNLYCIWSRIRAECLIENNYFKEVNDPYSIYIDDEPEEDYGKIGASGNILDNCAGVVDDGDDAVFTPPYAYTPDDAAMVPLIVQWGAGAEGQDGYPPHWLLGLYGDFDFSGLVDMSDLPEMADYWLATENIENADYFDNGIVDGGEFALFASNWRMIPPDVTAPAAPADLWALGQNAQAGLDWDDNSEEDFSGYNIYRSTVSGSGYTKLNGSLLANSVYTDSTAVNDIMYYYVVTAMDSSDNESGYSVEACAVPSADSDSIVIQENASKTTTGLCDIVGIVDTEEHSGYTGYGYCDTTNATGSGINWKLHIVSAGTYTFTWRFANGSSDRPARLLINSVEEVASINFPATGAWENWTTVSIQVTLTAGIKDVRLEATTSGGCANIDYFMVSGAAPEIAVCE